MRKPTRGENAIEPEQGADHPDDLEAGLELGEGPAPVGVRGVALHDRVEGHLPGGGRDAHHRAEQAGAGQVAQDDRDQAGTEDRQQEPDEHLLLGEHLPDAGRERRPGQRPEHADAGHHAEVPLGHPVLAEVEGEQQGEEAHDAADEAHGRRGQQHARAAQLGPLGRVGRSGRDRLRRQAQGDDRGGDERDGGQAERALRAEQLEEQRRRGHARRSP